MAQVHFTSHLKRLAPDAYAAKGATVSEALADVFRANPQLRAYVLDEQGDLRKHVCVFADGERLAHDVALATRVGAETEIYVMQALSGG